MSDYNNYKSAKNKSNSNKRDNALKLYLFIYVLY